jgi:hypothetical protein
MSTTRSWVCSRPLTFSLHWHTPWQRASVLVTMVTARGEAEEAEAEEVEAEEVEAEEVEAEEDLEVEGQAEEVEDTKETGLNGWLQDFPDLKGKML